jgi:hypothetical protein
MNRIGTFAVSAVLMAAAARTAAAQLTGIPYSPVETGTGISIAADYGKPDNKAGGGSAYAVTGGIGFSSFGLSASVGAIKPSGSTSAATQFGGRLGMKLFGGGLMPVTIGAQIGAAHLKITGVGGSFTTTTILPSVFVRVSPPLFPLKPWGNVYYLTGSCSTTSGTCTVEKEVRFAVGVNFNLLLGLGVHAGYDWGNKNGNSWGVGAHFSFHVPGLGVPGVPGM